LIELQHLGPDFSRFPDLIGLSSIVYYGAKAAIPLSTILVIDANTS
jgi:hypothetical protein